MAQSYLGQKRLRKYYGKIREVLDMPNLIEVQKSSYDLFLNSGDQPAPLDGEGIKGVFQSVFPIKDFNETSILEFVGLHRWRYFSLASVRQAFLSSYGRNRHDRPSAWRASQG